MTLTAEQTKAEGMLNLLVSKSWEDADFKQQLIATPEEAIESVTKGTLNLPEGVTISVNDQSDSSVYYFNIPPRPNLDNMELSDEQLEIVAGGEIAISSTAIVTWAVGGAIAGAIVGGITWYAFS